MRFRKHKYNARPIYVDGIYFPSTKEGLRYKDLKLLERAGEIRDLRRQRTFKMIVNNKLITTYRLDFIYMENGKMVAEDTKGFRTQEYKIKAKLFKALYPEYIFKET